MNAKVKCKFESLSFEVVLGDRSRVVLIYFDFFPTKSKENLSVSQFGFPNDN